MNDYLAPPWLVGGNAQTIWPALLGRSYRGLRPTFRRERWPTPDGDFIDVDWQGDDPQAPLLVLFHGLEGSSTSHYALAFADWARARGWRYAVPHFRGCSGELNVAPRAYHSGDHEEVAWMLARFRALHEGAIVAVGISLGGNALLRFAEEAGEGAAKSVRAIAAVSAPLDLAAAGHAIGTGGNRFYTRVFLQTLKPKALQMAARFPALLDAERIRSVRSMWEFDDAVTAPLHGFEGADDYWSRGSSKHWLAHIDVPTLVLNALNDPFIPAGSLAQPGETSAAVTLEQPPEGGHAGFVTGRMPGRLDWLPRRLAQFFADNV